MKREIWKDIAGYEGKYKVSSFGNVKSFLIDSKGKLLKPRLHKITKTYSYLSVALQDKSFSIHRLVAQAFIPNKEKKPCVNHKDSNSLNNHVFNLEWCTHKENTSHAIQSGNMKKFVQGSTKLTKSEVLQIRAMHKEFTQEQLASMYKVSRQNISNIIRRKTFIHI